MCKLFLLLNLFFLYQGTSKAIGFGDWAATTKNGTEFRDPGGAGTMRLANGDEYQLPQQWYFYRKHIIGYYLKPLSTREVERYFVVDEITGSYREFSDEVEWQSYLRHHNLRPLVWTRWHSRQWKNGNLLIFLTIFTFPFRLPLIYFGLRQIYRAIKIDSFNFRSQRTIMALILPALVLTIMLLGEFPGSI